MTAIAIRPDSLFPAPDELTSAIGISTINLDELPTDRATELALMPPSEDAIGLTEVAALPTRSATVAALADTALADATLELVDQTSWRFLSDIETATAADIDTAAGAIDPLTGQSSDFALNAQRLPPDFQFPPGWRDWPDWPGNPDEPADPDAPDDSNDSSDDNSNASFDPIVGYGLIDAAAAVSAAWGQTIGTEVADTGGVDWGNDLINAPEVWAEGITGDGVVIAVIDSGTDITHPELAPNLWTNSDEVMGDGIDNDGNGYVDDVYGWNFEVGQFDGAVLPGTTNPGQDHGTHVAGIIAAENDGVGMTGVAHNAQIMSLRLGDVGPGPGGASVFLNSGSLAEAIYYAVDNGADIINMSLGTSPSLALQQALDYAADNNVFVVSAAGNSGLAFPSAPASYAVDAGASVGAVDANGNLAYFSNQAGFDPDIQHVTAPGVDVYSTLPNGGYGYKSGTSMAAPYVAGVVALMLEANPNLTVDEIGEILTTA